MARHSDEELGRLLEDTGELLRDVEVQPGEEFSLDAILAEYGSAAGTEPQEKQEPVPEPEAEPGLEENPESAPEDKAEPAAMTEAEPEDTASAPEVQEPVFAPDTEAQEAASPAEPAQKEETEKIPLETIMDQTVSRVLEQEEKERRQEQKAERRKEFIGHLGALAGGAVKQLRRKRPPETKREDGPAAQRQRQPEVPVDEAALEAKRQYKKSRGALVRTAIPTVLLVAVTAGQTLLPLPEIWYASSLLRCGVMGGLLLTAALLAMPLWQELVRELRRGRIGAGLSAAAVTVLCLGDCVWGMVYGCVLLPLSAAAALVIFCCLWGQMLRWRARQDSFRLAAQGGMPPWVVCGSEAGICKRRGTMDGFYTMTMEPDPASRWQQAAVPLLLVTANVLAGVVCLSGKMPLQPLWIWTALLAASAPLSLPLSGTLPVGILSRRLYKSGCAVAGFAGARSIADARRLVVTDEDLFPAGTVSLNGIKVYGEEIGKVVSYAATVANAADSQVLPLLEQMLTAEGGSMQPLDDFRWYEEGGAGGTIRGETVVLGSAYCMKQQKVRLPKELKLKTGLFLAVDGQLTAIFALRYQPSRNVEWALRALRRSRMVPVMAVRGCNVTPGLLKRSFKTDAKAVYPDVSTRLQLWQDMERVSRPNAVLYRDGLAPLAEAAIGSRRAVRAIRAATVLCYLGALAGLLLCYYLTGIGGFASLTPLRLVLFQLLWAVPTVLLAGQVKYF